MAAYKWKVEPAPTGQYRSFEHRSWPTAYYPDDKIAALIVCTEPYVPAHARVGNHPPLTLRVASYQTTPFKWRKVNREFKTLEEAKDAFARIVVDHPELVPSEADK